MLPKILTILALLIIAYGFIRWELYKSKQRTIPHAPDTVKLRRSRSRKQLSMWVSDINGLPEDTKQVYPKPSRKKKIEIDTQQQPEIVRMTREFDKKRKRKAAMSRSSK